MAVTTGTSLLLSAFSSVLIFSGMQMFKPWFSSSQLHTLLGGYLGSLLFILFLTALGNLETCLFGKSFQVKLFPEATIHRVCGTSCLLISLCALYYMNRYSQKIHVTHTAPVVVQSGKKKKHVS
ncbi:hypothetical protein NQ314_013156 [Rhamnusium bicolor]|uniref:Dolichyl-diphosphooligosaccharide--protein glycosyltransferase subunit KCP2 n=1 Tax=Rhamnusium bicolor TaxID=1586634 RepID=A0AAV8X8M4_9CUCU|nr:hypothetical protein NQ314_013156 [Rhamnusium bicolor]